MNIDTVETVQEDVTSESVTVAQTPESIRQNYNLKWFGPKATNGPANVETGKVVTEVTDAQSEINDWFAINNLTINGKTRPTIQLLKREYTHRVFIDNKNYMLVESGGDFKATYEATFGATNETGASSTDICGEATYWFKLDKDCQNGYGITFDNHTGCGYFNTNDNELYLVEMKDRVIKAVDYSKYKAQFVNFKQYPEYGIKISEENGTATVEIWPNNAKAGLNDNVANGSGEYSTANSNRIKWTGIDVGMYDTEFTQGYDFWDFNGIYFADCKTSMEYTIIKQIVKSFGDIVYEPEWTDGALHMLIHILTSSKSSQVVRNTLRNSSQNREYKL